MKTFITCFSILFLGLHLYAQNISGTELLEKSIQFHDPEHQWNSLQAHFTVTMKTPKGADRVSKISLDHKQAIFDLAVTKEADTYSYHITKDSCAIQLNGNAAISDEDAKEFRLSCERGAMYKDYYSYLYGLPMKLKDPGTNIDETVTLATFKGKEYLRLKVTYDQEVGKDTWYFYFDPKTYAMEVYQFYHDESKNDGEYILLSDLETVSSLKLPKVRAWYYNKDDKYLGTDILN